MRYHRTTKQTLVLALRGMMVALVLAIVRGGHFGSEAEYQPMPGHDSQVVQSETGGTYPTDPASGHCVTSESCQFVLPTELAVLATVAIVEHSSLVASGPIGSPLLTPLFRPPRQA